jgi:large subunit ribosomal protein L19
MATSTAIRLSPVKIEERKRVDVKAGDTIKVTLKIEDKGKTRLQAFEGLVLARKHGTTPGATITVRKVSNGVGVERIFPLYSPSIEKIEIIKRSETRRSKLYFIREKAAKEIRKRMRMAAFTGNQLRDADEEVAEEVVEETVEEAPVEAVETTEAPVEETTETTETATEEATEEEKA